MKKRIIPKTAAFAMAAALVMPITVCAAPPTAAPIEISVKQDGKAHKVFVFGQSLALVSPDGSIEISCMGPVGRVDVMIDGVLTKNVASIDIPASQQTKMVLDENSIIVKNVSAKSGEVVKKQISDAYASGTASIDLASLAGVTAYKVNADGQVEDASGKAVTSSVIGMSVSSTEAASVSFEEEIKEIEIAEQEAKAEAAAKAMAEAEAKAAAEAASKGNSSGSTGGSSSTPGGSSSTSGDNSGTPGDNSGTPGDNSGTPGDNSGTPGDNNGTPGGDNNTIEDQK